MYWRSIERGTGKTSVEYYNPFNMMYQKTKCEFINLLTKAVFILLLI